MAKTYRLIEKIDNRIGASYRGQARYIVQKRILWFWWKEVDNEGSLPQGMLKLEDRRRFQRPQIRVLVGDVMFEKSTSPEPRKGVEVPRLNVKVNDERTWPSSRMDEGY